ncbi:hypothetical protein GNI_035490 [Gregarina niphandrodes]|uniref:START domain-containing protein n=1 Tax=Gregarina niphandrodes TaxID=110365 RepID=A0A023BAQ4_GRENI|nr:hypothetical protein GNI_035490 [Gregarina niphandrodes]EZG78493.1 hypothetical protein GNI_035490 [Gregarina niphandrodes]|eukprot:XP_011129277.1 hypothetical protein GNI_035490 [Gregarina niphandrodes]
MTICGCKSSKAAKEAPSVAAPVIEETHVVAVVLQPEVGDALGQTIGVSQSGLDKRHSTVKRVFSLRSATPSDLESRNLSARESGDNIVLTSSPSGEQGTKSAEQITEPVQSPAPPVELVTQPIASGATASEQVPKAVDIDATLLKQDSPTVMDSTASMQGSPAPATSRSGSIDPKREAEPPPFPAENAEMPIQETPVVQIRQAETLKEDPLQSAAENLDSPDAKIGVMLRPDQASVPIALVSEVLPQPLASAQSLPSMRMNFLKKWFDVLQLCADDVKTWIKTEALLKAHILARLVRIDCERAQAVLEGSDKKFNEIGASTSCILPVDGNLPFLETVIPAEVLVEIGGGADILLDVKQNSSPAELERLLASAKSLVDFCQSSELRDLQERWNCFGDVISVFDLAQRVSFDLHPLSLMRQPTVDKWNAVIGEYGATITDDALRVQSAPASAPAVDVKKKGFRRSMSRSVKKMGQKIKYRRKHGETANGKPDEPWVADEKPQLSLAYKMHSDGNVSVKVRCKLPISFIKMVLVLDDVAAFKNWLPYCSEVNLLKKFGTASYLLSYIADMPWPIRKRETLAYCEGIDALDEIGQIIVLVKNPPLTAGKATVFELPLPEPLPKIPRIPKCAMAFFIHPLEKEVTGVELFAKLDPGMSMSILKGIIPWLVKNCVVDFMVKIAKMANDTDVEAVIHSDRNPEFYQMLKGRGLGYLSSLEPQPDNQPLTEKQRRALGFDDNDVLWHEKLPVLKL